MVRVALLLFLALATTSLLIPRSSVQGTTLPQLDLVLAIDHSGSMNSESDVDGLRLRAAKQLADALAASRDALTVRMGVVAFGAPAFSPGLQVTALTPVSEPSLQGALAKRELSGTDYTSALCLSWAAATLQRPPKNANCNENLPYDTAIGATQPPDLVSRVVVLITDGEPSPDGASHKFTTNDSPARCDPSQSPTQGQVSYAHTYMCSLMTTWKALNAAKPVTLAIIGLDRDASWFPYAEPYWRIMTGCEAAAVCASRIIRSADPSSLTADLLKAAANILYNLCGVSNGANECRLPASLSEVQFLIEGATGPENIRIISSAGTVVEPGPNVEVTATPGGQRWRIRMPPKGVWRVETSRPGAQLTVSTFLVLQKFKIAADPASPSAGAAVSFNLDIDGEPSVDVKSLLNETLQLKLQRGNEAPSSRDVSLVQRGNANQFRIERAITSAEQGHWSAALTIDISGTPAVLADTSFDVVTRAATPTPTVPAPTATPKPDTCEARFQPAGASVASEKLGLHFSYPVTFHSPASVAAVLQGSACPVSAGSIHGRLSLSPTEPCPTSGACENETRGPSPLRLSLPLAEDAGDRGGLTRTISVERDGAWQDVAKEDFSLKTPWIFKLERDSKIGYWIPFALLLLVFLAWSAASTYDRRSGVPLWKIGAFNQRRTRNEPIVRFRLGVWRSVVANGKRGLLTRKQLLAGPLVLRIWPDKPDATARRTLKGILQHWSRVLPGFLKGSAEAVATVNLSEIKRVRGR